MMTPEEKEYREKMRVLMMSFNDRISEAMKAMKNAPTPDPVATNIFFNQRHERETS